MADNEQQDGGGGVHNVEDILDRLRDLAGRQDRVTIGDVVDAMGQRSFGPFLLIPALIDISPIGSIPTLPTLLAVMIVITAVQLLLGRKTLWLPGFITRRGAKARKVKKAADKLDELARRLDRWFHGRLPALTSPWFQRLAALAIIALTFTIPPLELIPLATTAPMAAIAAFGLAMLVRDGLLMLVAFAGSLAAIGFGISMLMGGAGGG
ncbi:membrane protein [Croceibacterium mercuriale]|uniref:Membrane protein n=1 Tax=Croceibacterium mercuriale TaxID=1572751 RepID=A0A0B2BYW2_9SPHN|nr:exopolysaccharide biosynthesis protein [Croceibacterium mercuriale]KHL24881.1 membrane protein [Croceibacterium mercuriale]